MRVKYSQTQKPWAEQQAKEQESEVVCPGSDEKTCEGTLKLRESLLVAVCSWCQFRYLSYSIWLMIVIHYHFVGDPR